MIHYDAEIRFHNWKKQEKMITLAKTHVSEAFLYTQYSRYIVYTDLSPYFFLKFFFYGSFWNVRFPYEDWKII